MTTSTPTTDTTPAAVAPLERLSFAYRAQTRDGTPINGTLEADDLDDAHRQLRAPGVRLLEIAPAERVGERRRRWAALSGEDFATFNQQLAHLTRAGLPVEHGLRLIAQDMRRGRLSATVNRVADELNRGTPLPEAFEKFRRQFPPLYGRLIEAGIRSNNLSGMLLNLGRHVEMVHRLRAAVWRVSAYPLTVLLGLVLILLALTTFVLPQIAAMYSSFNVPQWSFVSWQRLNISPELPLVTRWVVAAGAFLPHVLIGIAAVLVLGPVLWFLLRLMGRERAVGDALLLPLPLVGPVLKDNLVARWVDALSIGISAGMDLPAAIEVAGEAVGTARLRHDGRMLIDALEHGRALSEVKGLRLLPPAVPAAIDLAARGNDLPTTLETLSQMYQQQAEMRLRILPAVLTPILLLLVAGCVGFVMIAVLLPLFKIMSAFSGGML